MVNKFRKPKEHGALMTGWGWAGCSAAAAASSSSYYLHRSFAKKQRVMSYIYKLGRADWGTALTEGKEQAVVRNCSAQK